MTFPMTATFDRDRAYFRLVCWLVATLMVGLGVALAALIGINGTNVKLREDLEAERRKASDERVATATELAGLRAAWEAASAQLRTQGVEPLVHAPPRAEAPGARRRAPAATTTSTERPSTSTTTSSTSTTTTSSTSTTRPCVLPGLPACPL